MRDASGAISLEVPAEWRDVVAKPSRYPGAHILRSDAQAVLWAAADTAELDSRLSTAGVIVEASKSLGATAVLPKGHLPRESGLWFFRHRPRLVLTRECPNARFDGLGQWGSTRVAGVGNLRKPGSRVDVPVAETGQLVQRTVGRLAGYGVTATWLCPGLEPRVVEILFLSKDGSTFVYMQFPLPGGDDVDRMARVLESFRLRAGKVPKPA